MEERDVEYFISVTFNGPYTNKKKRCWQHVFFVPFRYYTNKTKKEIRLLLSRASRCCMFCAAQIIATTLNALFLSLNSNENGETD